jgi:hypothetical protein
MGRVTKFVLLARVQLYSSLVCSRTTLRPPTPFYSSTGEVSTSPSCSPPCPPSCPLRRHAGERGGAVGATGFGDGPLCARHPQHERIRSKCRGNTGREGSGRSGNSPEGSCFKNRFLLRSPVRSAASGLLHTRTRAEHFAWYRRHACHKHRTTGVVARPFGPLTRPVLPR